MCYSLIMIRSWISFSMSCTFVLYHQYKTNLISGNHRKYFQNLYCLYSKLTCLFHLLLIIRKEKHFCWKYEDLSKYCLTFHYRKCTLPTYWITKVLNVIYMYKQYIYCIMSVHINPYILTRTLYHAHTYFNGC